MNRKYKILVTGIGGLIGYGIVESLKRSSYDLELYGIDIFDNAYGRFVVDHFILQTVHGASEEYLSFIQNVIEENDIDLVFFGLEPEMFNVFDHRDSLPDKFVLNSELCVAMCRDKWVAYDYLKNNSQLTLIPTKYNVGFAECAEAFGTPFMLKPIQSSASRGIEMINEEYEFDFFTKKVGGNCIYQKLVGDDDNEYTVAIFGDGQGDFLDHIIFRRTLARTGATSKATVVQEDPEIFDYLKEISRVLKPIGPTNVQVRKDGKKVYLLEINARISSTCSFRTSLGYNEPEMCIDYFMENKPIVPKPKPQASMTRHVVDHVYYE